jgi:NAD(P)-dependent dehydrogenase (short-subunit alcohol dehydrogenase family)
MESLQDRVAVVTGAGSGIGRALALRLSVERMRVVASDVEADALAETGRLLSASPSRAPSTTLRADVARADDVAALAEHAWTTFGSVDVLANVAGVFAGGLIWERPAADFEWALGVNLWGILHAVRSFVPRMIAQGTEAHIVNVVSMSGFCATPFTAPYNVSKFAAMAATECLAHDLATTGARVRVSAVAPGFVNTRIAEARRNRPAELTAEPTPDALFVEEALRDGTAGGADPAEVAGLIVDAVRTGAYLVPTRASFADQLRQRTEALLGRALPPIAAFD